VADAKVRASQLAAAAGVTLGAPIAISETSAPRPLPVAAPVGGMAVATPIQPGTTQVEVDVEVTYAIGG
jgi:uncharacterized protein YggE